MQVRGNARETLVDSGVADNLFVQISQLTAHTNISSGQKIAYGFLLKTNDDVVIYLPKPEYLCRLQLFDKEGNPVAKTAAGEKYGRLFADLESYSWDYVNKRGHNTGGSDKPDMILPHVTTTQNRELSSMEELFIIEKAGCYKLSIQFQVFKLSGEGANHIFRVVRMPPIEMFVEKK